MTDHEIIQSLKQEIKLAKIQIKEIKKDIEDKIITICMLKSKILE